MPFAAGIVLGYLFDPLADRFEKIGFSRTLATCCVFITVLVILVPLLILLFGTINGQLSILIDNAPRYMAALMQKIEPVLTRLQDRFPDAAPENFTLWLKDHLTDNLRIGGRLLQGLFSNGFAFINLLSMLLITPVVAFYMLRDWDTFVRKIDNLLPRHAQADIRTQFKKIDQALSGFIRGQISVCVILGLYYAFGLHLIGLDLGLLVGFLAGLISFIPYVGSISGFLISIVLAFSQFNDPTKIFEVVAVFAVGQFTEGNFLTPKLVGENVGLHPVWVMFALLAGGALLGFLGLLIAVPTAAVIGVLIRYLLEHYQNSSLYRED
jgi:predicted PurR-regulated permease PerM